MVQPLPQRGQITLPDQVGQGRQGAVCRNFRQQAVGHRAGCRFCRRLQIPVIALPDDLPDIRTAAQAQVTATNIATGLSRSVQSSGNGSYSLAGLPPGTGTKLAGAMLDFLRGLGVSTVHLGTQTAGPFYEQVGFRVTRRLIPELRNRRTADGRVVPHDLVMLEMDL